MQRGNPQGQIGADLIFIMQQLVLRELDKIQRFIYMDDLNDLASDDNKKATIELAIQNEKALIHQVKQVGFKLNDTKTEYIPFNVESQMLVDAGLKTKNIKSGEITMLGIPFIPLINGIDIEPTANMIIKRLNQKIRTMHAIRGYVDDKDLLVKIARCLFHHCAGEVHIVRAYEKGDKLFQRITIKANALIKAIGLTVRTPQKEVDRLMGTSLADFAGHAILINV